MPINDANLLESLDRLARRQQSVLAKFSTDDRSESQILREELDTEGTWSNAEAEKLIDQVIRPTVNEKQGFWPWESLEEGVGDLVQALFHYTSWHDNLIQARAAEDMATALSNLMRAWFRFKRGEIGKAIQTRQKRMVLAKDNQSEDDDGDPFERILGDSPPDLSPSDLSNLSEGLIRGLSMKGELPPANPSDRTDEWDDPLVQLFLEWSLWQWLPLDRESRPFGLRDFSKWTQQAWAQWQGIPNASAHGLAKKLLKHLELMPEQLGKEGSAHLTSEEFCQVIQTLQETYFDWKPKFVVTQSFL